MVAGEDILQTGLGALFVGGARTLLRCSSREKVYLIKWFSVGVVVNFHKFKTTPWMHLDF